MPDFEVCPHCRKRARQEKTIWSTNRPPVHVFVCDPCQHTFLVHEDKVDTLGLPMAASTVTPTIGQA